MRTIVREQYLKGYALARAKNAGLESERPENIPEAIRLNPIRIGKVIGQDS